jgi:hypothetical protein
MDANHGPSALDPNDLKAGSSEDIDNDGKNGLKRENCFLPKVSSTDYRVHNLRKALQKYFVVGVRYCFLTKSIRPT